MSESQEDIDKIMEDLIRRVGELSKKRIRVPCDVFDTIDKTMKSVFETLDKVATLLEVCSKIEDGDR